ncbi:hypothetical protein LINPERHAP1_LOCUS11874 [Linum perenne]
MSHPSATSTRWVRRALTLSRVTMIGSGGLFLDPAACSWIRRLVLGSGGAASWAAAGDFVALTASSTVVVGLDEIFAGGVGAVALVGVVEAAAAALFLCFFFFLSMTPHGGELD